MEMNKETTGGSMSRRKLLASLGITGAAIMTGSLYTQASNQQSVSESVYMDPDLDADAIPYTLAVGQPERTVGDKLRESVSVKDFGAVGDGITNDTAAIQAAVDYVNAIGGGEIVFPTGVYRATGVRLYSYMTLRGPGHNIYGFSMSGKGAVIRSFDEGSIFYTAGTSTIHNITFDGLTLVGLQGLGPKETQGIVLHKAQGVIIDKCDFFIFKNEAVWQQDGGTLRMSNCKVFGVDRQGTSFPERKGSLRLAGNDNMVINTEIGAGSSGDQSNLWNCAVKLEGTANMFVNCVFEGADAGILVTGANNNFVNCRADINYGHGFWFTREIPTATPPWKNRLTNCWSHRNSRYGVNLFDNFRIDSGHYINGIQMTNCKSSHSSGDSWKHRYGLYDGAGDTLVVAFADEGAATKWVDGVNNYAGPYASFRQQVVTPANGTTEPDVRALSLIRFNNAVGTTVTNFVGGVNGQPLELLTLNSNTTIAHNSSIKTNTGASKTLNPNVVYRFKHVLGVWYESN